MTSLRVYFQRQVSRSLLLSSRPLELLVRITANDQEIAGEVYQTMSTAFATQSLEKGKDKTNNPGNRRIGPSNHSRSNAQRLYVFRKFFRLIHIPSFPIPINPLSAPPAAFPILSPKLPALLLCFSLSFSSRSCGTIIIPPPDLDLR